MFRRKKKLIVTGSGPLATSADQMTHRFTMNLPRGQKTVVRVSPLITLGQLMTSVCEDKSLDLRRHVLQIPGQPGVKVDLSSTIQQLGLHELNLVAVGLQDPRSHMVSMPDLSKPPPSAMMPPSYMPSAGETKKKRGFLSFLSKNKDKKFRPNMMETSSTTSHITRGPHPEQVSTRQATTPPALRREFGNAPHRPNHPDTRAKSMYITADVEHVSKRPLSTINHTQPQLQHQKPVDVTTNTAKKKRRAPAPPGQTQTQPTAQTTSSAPQPPSMVPPPAPDTSSKLPNGKHLHPEQQEQIQQHSAPTRAEILSRLHSRNSSDSSGYHELTLSGAESPEAPGTLEHQHSNAQHNAISSSSLASIESGPASSADAFMGGSGGANGDSGIHDLSPMRVSPTEEMTNKPNGSSSRDVAVDSTVNVASAAPTNNTATTSLTKTTSSVGGGRKKKKAPAPPPPLPTSQPPVLPVDVQTNHSSDTVTITSTVVIETATGATTNISDTNGLLAEDGHPTEVKIRHNSIDDVPEEPSPREASTPRQIDGESGETITVPITNGVADSETSSHTSNNKAAETPDAQTLQPQKHTNDAVLLKHNGPASAAAAELDDVDNDSDDLNENTAFDINDILEGVVFDDEPKSMELRLDGMRNEQAMVMEETASIASETVEQVEVARHERPCAFIPPPPPSEPPPPEVMPVDDIIAMGMTSDPILVDKETEVNDDNASLAPSSAKSSPGAVPTSYKNEMALFVERMSKMAVETSSAGTSGSGGPLDDSVSSLSIAASDTSDTGSVIQHVRGGSQDSRASGGSDGSAGGSLRGQTSTRSQVALPMTEEISVPVETVPPPPEFGDEDGKVDDGEDDEEYVTETVEKLIIPLTPRGYDFSAAQRVEEETKVTVESSSSQQNKNLQDEIENEKERRSSTGVFRAELVSIAPVAGVSKTPRPSTPPMAKEISTARVSVSAPVTPRSPTTNSPREKEEFVLTTEDLSNVTFLPPKPKMVKTAPVYKRPQTNESSGFVSSTTLSFSNNNSNVNKPVSSDTAVEPVSSPTSPRPVSILKYLPTMRAGGRFGPQPVSEFSNDLNNDTKNEKHTNSYEEIKTVKTPEADNANTYAISSASDIKINDTESSNLGDKDPQEALVEQYAALQAQFSQWQEQLNQNQSLLAAQASPSPSPGASLGKAAALKADQLQQLSEQVMAQQQMMQQLQITMQALQQQQQQPKQTQQPLKTNPVGNDRTSTTTSAMTVQTIAPPPPPPPPAPPAPQVNEPAPKEHKGIPKVRTLDEPRPPRPTGRQSRFEPVLDPREELMLAIRGFKGREGLKTVSVQQANWIAGNR